MTIAAIMPCRARAEQTVRNVKRLLATADYDAWDLHLIVDDDPETLRALFAAEFGGEVAKHRRFADVHLDTLKPRGGYWRCLAAATERTDATHLINLANDLIPGQHWLRRAVEGYQEQFGDGPGLLGFNGDSWGVEHSCHFLISRALLESYGGWPVHYDHNFGDTELCQRAIADRCYAKSAWALLFHDHPYFGGDDDPVYAEGRAQASKDERLFLARRQRGWR